MGTVWTLQRLFSATLIAVCVLASGNRVAMGQPNDCATIQGALNGLPPTGGEVKLQPGIYTCTGPILIDRDNVCLRGQGLATVLQLANGADAPVLVLGQALPNPTVTRRNLCVSDLVIDGNRLAQPDECWGGPCTANPIRNSGIVLRRVEDVQIERVTVRSARSAGLVSELGTRRLIVRDFTSSDNQFDGLAAYGTENSTFSGLHLYNNLYAGLSFDLGFNYNIVSGGVLTGNQKPGIFMRHAHNNMFHNIQIRDSGEDGIFLAENDETRDPATDNAFNSFIVSASARYGLRINDTSCVNNAVAASQFIGNISGCIFGSIQDLGHICINP